MKYATQQLLIPLISLSSFCTYAQNVGIGTNSPAEKLTILTPSSSYGLLHTDGTISVGTWVGNGGGYIGTKSLHPLRFFTGDGTTQLTLLTNGNFGIGTVSPLTKLSIQTPNNTDGFSHTSDGGIILKETVGGVSAGIGTYSNHTFRLVANSNPVINIDPLGNVGVGLIDQTYKMDIADRIRIRSGAGSTAGIWLNNPDNSATIAFMGTKDINIAGIYGNGAAGWSFLMNTDNGYVGIGANVPNPANKLQIGSVGATGFGGNDLAIGNGTNVMAIYQSNAYTNIASTTDIVLQPRNNGHGRVGINTSTPRFPLEVADNVVKSGASYRYYNGSFNNNNSAPCDPCDAGVSIFAASAVYANEFDAFSDARIKDIEDVSNARKDLEILNRIQVTNYTMKDKVKDGNKPYKKVIAQQVEEVYPQVVNKTVNYIPNVYQLTNKIEKTGAGYLLSLPNKHNLDKEAKKIQLINKNGVREQYDIISIPSDKQILIGGPDVKSDTVFVYGEQVNDFYTVDYDGLTTLNISATQELSNLVKKQQEEIDAQSARIDELMRLLKKMHKKHQTVSTK